MLVKIYLRFKGRIRILNNSIHKHVFFLLKFRILFCHLRIYPTFIFFYIQMIMFLSKISVNYQLQSRLELKYLSTSHYNCLQIAYENEKCCQQLNSGIMGQLFRRRQPRKTCFTYVNSIAILRETLWDRGGLGFVTSFVLIPFF